MGGGWNTIKEFAAGLAFVVVFCVIAWYAAAFIGLALVWLLFTVGVSAFCWIVGVLALVVIGIICSLW